MKNRALKVLSLSLFLLSSCGEKPHEHILDDIWHYDGIYHWHECTSGDGYVGDKEMHKYDQYIQDEKYLVREATCQEQGKYYRSCICGDHTTVTFYTDKKDHNYGPWTETEVEGVTVRSRTCTNCGEVQSYEVKPFAVNSIPEYHSYKSHMLSYLEDESANIANYKSSDITQYDGGVEISWNYTGDDVENYDVYLSLNEDFSDVKTLTTTQLSATFDNLYKASTYYVKVVENKKNGTKTPSTTSFVTSSLGPRVISIDGSINTRDIGGYDVGGHLTKQGLIYRSAQFKKNITGNITKLSEKGEDIVRNELKLKTQLDLRATTEIDDPSPIVDGLGYRIFSIGGYGFNGNPDLIKAIFQLLALESTYPVVYHCNAGADRTGTISYLIEGLLGVSMTDIVHDYEFTSFSSYGLRNTQGDSEADYSHWWNYMIKVTNYKNGDTLQEKIIKWLQEFGVTDDELRSIININNGNKNCSLYQ